MEQSNTSLGVVSILEKTIRSHPLFYIIIRSLIRFTSIFEKDFDGLKIINFKDKINIIDVGASDGISAKFFLNNLKVNKIICFEPNKKYVKILKKIKGRNIIVKPYALGNKISVQNIYFPRYKFFNKYYDIITYTHYDKRLINHYIKDFKYRKNLKIIKQKIHIKKMGFLKKKIHLIKIDTNGYEFSVILGLKKLIKRDKPVIILELNKDEKKIAKVLKKFKYMGYYYSSYRKKFLKQKQKHTSNKYFLHHTHFFN
tara:strand:+ start:599 stop:1366 length:768 start_codon:yes stop_codon:yes gene_type:complete